MNPYSDHAMASAEAGCTTTFVPPDIGSYEHETSSTPKELGLDLLDGL